MTFPADQPDDDDDAPPASGGAGGAPAAARYWGKYRGVVVNHVDPLGIGRLLISVPDVTGVSPGTWALPCLPVAGRNTGLVTLPIPGTNVWVEYEAGDPDRPIWTGCFWGSAADMPAMARVTPPGVPQITMQTVTGTGLMISDAPGPTGGILLKTATGAMIAVTDAGIVIQNGQGASVTLTGPTVTVNAGALAIT